MGVTIGDGQMVVIDETVDPPVIVFDSTEKLLNCTELVVGSVTLPARTATTLNGITKFPVTINANHVLASVNPAADIVLGGFAVTTFGGSQGINGLGVYNASGNYVHYQDGAHSPSTMIPTNSGGVVNFAAYRFFASGGTLYLNEWVRLDAWTSFSDITINLTLLSIKFDYKLFVGTLT